LSVVGPDNHSLSSALTGLLLRTPPHLRRLRPHRGVASNPLRNFRSARVHRTVAVQTSALTRRSAPAGWPGHFAAWTWPAGYDAAGSLPAYDLIARTRQSAGRC